MTGPATLESRLCVFLCRHVCIICWLLLFLLCVFVRVCLPAQLTQLKKLNVMMLIRKKIIVICCDGKSDDDGSDNGNWDSDGLTTCIQYE